MTTITTTTPETIGDAIQQAWDDQRQASAAAAAERLAAAELAEQGKHASAQAAQRLADWLADRAAEAAALCEQLEQYREEAIEAACLDAIGALRRMAAWSGCSILDAAEAATTQAAYEEQLQLRAEEAAARR